MRISTRTKIKRTEFAQKKSENVVIKAFTQDLSSRSPDKTDNNKTRKMETNRKWRKFA